MSIVERESGRIVDCRLLRLLTPCYLTVQLGSATLAAEIVACPDDEARLRSRAAGCMERLRRVLTGMET